MTRNKIISAVLIAVLALCVLCLSFHIIGNAVSQIPAITQMNYNYNSDNEPLTINDIERLSQRISFNKVGFCAELEETKIKNIEVTPVLTNECYSEIYGQKLTGEGITKQNIENKDKVAIIGSSLSLKLFFNTDAVGKSFTLNGDRYTVCGIIEENESIINGLSTDGKQRIYLPYTSYSYYEICDVCTISYENTASSAPLIEQMNLNQYHSTDFSEKAKVIKSLEHIFCFLLFIVLCFIFIKLWYILCKRLIKDIMLNLGENYIFSSIKATPLKYVLLLVTALGIPAVLLLVYLVCDFSIFIIPKYIPYDNVFDMSYYISAIVENSNYINSLALTGDTSLINLYSETFNMLVWLLIIFVMMILVLIAVVNMIINMIDKRLWKF